MRTMGSQKPVSRRERLYEIIAKDQGQDKFSRWYDRYILVLVCLSVVPLVF